MGLLSQSDWSAKWIQDPGYTYATDGVPNPLPVFAKAFDAGRRIVKARLYITGLGQYAARLNGLPVTGAVLEPGQTSYWAEVDYRTYDVTRLLRPGSQRPRDRDRQRRLPAGRQHRDGPVHVPAREQHRVRGPKVIAQLEVTYATARRRRSRTDPSWLTEPGPTTFSSWWGGEDYDARRIPADWTSSARNLTGPGWRDASLAALTASTIPRATTPLVANPRPPVTVAREARPVSITKVTPPADSTTLVAPVQPGATNVKVASVTNLYPGDTISIDTGASMESRKVTAVGTAAGPATTLAAPAAAGDTNIKVASTGTPVQPGRRVHRHDQLHHRPDAARRLGRPASRQSRSRRWAPPGRPGPGSPSRPPCQRRTPPGYRSGTRAPGSPSRPRSASPHADGTAAAASRAPPTCSTSAPTWPACPRSPPRPPPGRR